MDLGLLQEQIGVSKNTIYNWEKGRAQPAKQHYPRITEFLGQAVARLITKI